MSIALSTAPAARPDELAFFYLFKHICSSLFVFVQQLSPVSDGKRVSIPVSAATKKECIRAAELIKAEHRSVRKVAQPACGI